VVSVTCQQTSPLKIFSTRVKGNRFPGQIQAYASRLFALADRSYWPSCFAVKVSGEYLKKFVTQWHRWDDVVAASPSGSHHSTRLVAGRPTHVRESILRIPATDCQPHRPDLHQFNVSGFCAGTRSPHAQDISRVATSVPRTTGGTSRRRSPLGNHRRGGTARKGQGKVLPICLAEIDRARPFFIGLIGDRYGWVPNPDQFDRLLSWSQSQGREFASEGDEHQRKPSNLKNRIRTSGFPVEEDYLGP
jgi:hypothetical protein